MATRKPQTRTDARRVAKPRRIDLHQPFRIVVCRKGWTRGRMRAGRHPYTPIQPTTVGIIAWQEDTTAEPWREGFGSFLFLGIHRTRATVAGYLANPATVQVAVRTNPLSHSSQKGRPTQWEWMFTASRRRQK